MDISTSPRPTAARPLPPERAIATEQVNNFSVLSTFQPPSEADVVELDRNGRKALNDIQAQSLSKSSAVVAAATAKIVDALQAKPKTTWAAAYLMQQTFESLAAGYPTWMQPATVMANLGAEAVLSHHFSGDVETSLEESFVQAVRDTGDEFAKASAETVLSQYQALRSIPEQRGHAADVLTNFLFAEGNYTAPFPTADDK